MHYRITYHNKSATTLENSTLDTVAKYIKQSIYVHGMPQIVEELNEDGEVLCTHIVDFIVFFPITPTGE